MESARVRLDPEASIEALLYAAGRPLGVEELAKHSGIKSRRKVLRLVRNIAKKFNSLFKAIEVVEYPGQKFILQLSPSYTRLATTVSGKRLLPPSVMKTLAYVAYYQPVPAREIALKRGTHAYTHLKVLETMGLIYHEKGGKQKVYGTTRLFSQYWGLSENPEELKKQLSKLRILRRPGKQLNLQMGEASGP